MSKFPPICQRKNVAWSSQSDCAQLKLHHFLIITISEWSTTGRAATARSFDVEITSASRFIALLSKCDSDQRRNARGKIPTSANDATTKDAKWRQSDSKQVWDFKICYLAYICNDGLSLSCSEPWLSRT